MEEFGSWYFDLARSWDGSFPHQGPPQPLEDSYGKWSAIGEPAEVAVPEMLRMAAKAPSAEDPRGMEQRFVVKSLFNSKDGLLGKSLDGVDRELLFEVVRSGSRNQDGHARGAFSTVYSNLSLTELKPVLPVIHRAILEKSPGGEMFDSQIQMAGLDQFSRHHVSEGIELTADYLYLQKPHGSDGRMATMLEMLKRCGAHAQRAIPRLKKGIHYFENEEQDFPENLSLQKAEKVREAIREIRAMTEKPELAKLGL